MHQIHPVREGPLRHRGHHAALGPNQPEPQSANLLVGRSEGVGGTHKIIGPLPDPVKPAPLSFAPTFNAIIQIYGYSRATAFSFWAAHSYPLHREIEYSWELR